VRRDRREGEEIRSEIRRGRVREWEETRTGPAEAVDVADELEVLVVAATRGEGDFGVDLFAAVVSVATFQEWRSSKISQQLGGSSEIGSSKSKGKAPGDVLTVGSGSDRSWTGDERSAKVRGFEALGEEAKGAIESRRGKEDKRSGSLKVILSKRLDHGRSSLKKRSVRPEEVEEAGVGFADGVQ
jgi:hypothetical protein